MLTTENASHSEVLNCLYSACYRDANNYTTW